ncbi:hypothetical protein H4I96_02115 [Botrytis cinerea]
MTERHQTKRRRYDSEVSTPGYSSPDELADDKAIRPSASTRRDSTRRQSRPYSSDGSADELDHTHPTIEVVEIPIIQEVDLPLKIHIARRNPHLHLLINL